MPHPKLVVSHNAVLSWIEAQLRGRQENPTSADIFGPSRS